MKRYFIQNIREEIIVSIKISIEDFFDDLTPNQIFLEKPKLSEHGDFSSNIALQLSKKIGLNPREIASKIIKNIKKSEMIRKVEIAGPGFINFYLTDSVKKNTLHNIFYQKELYGCINIGKKRKIHLEYVSANPTGPIHVGHGRGAALGKTLSNILKFSGYEVHKEYYVNDAGRQIDILVLSVFLRILEIEGLDIHYPNNCYRGGYVKTIAQDILKRNLIEFEKEENVFNKPNYEHNDEEILDLLIKRMKDKLNKNYKILKEFILSSQIDNCKGDLKDFGITFDNWFSERSLFENKAIEKIIEVLEKKGLVYFSENALWFKSKEYGDEKDRVLKRSNGSYTYFASDIAYHYDKIKRGYDRIINIWGADHHGYTQRIYGALDALDISKKKIEVILVQFASLYRNKKKISISTRTGEFISIKELINDIGKNAARFFYILRKSDQHLEFDLDLAKLEKVDNPMYYIQYAHARGISLIKKSKLAWVNINKKDYNHLKSEFELSLLSKMQDFPLVLELGVKELSPHYIPIYLRELASIFHKYYSSVTIINENEDLTKCRIAIVFSVVQILKNGLKLLDIEALDEM